MKQFRFREWKVYKDSQILFSLLLSIVEKMGKEHRYELGSQLLRSGSSILLNIAEGSGKQSEKELNRFIDIALGSAYETLANIDILNSNNLINKEDFTKTEQIITEICRQLGAFKKKLKL